MRIAAVEKHQNAVPQQIQIEVVGTEKEAEGVYANFFLISHSPSEVFLDFARLLPNVPKARVHARIIVTPQHARSLLQTLEQNLKMYEGQFGPIKLPGESPAANKGLGFTSS